MDTTRSSTTVLGEAVHEGLKAFLGGSDEHPVFATDTDEERLKYAYDATLSFLNKYPDGFIDYKKNVPNRTSLEELALTSIAGYIKEWDRSEHKEMIYVENKLQESVRVKIKNKEIELPIPLVGYADHVYLDNQDRVRIDDHKTVFRYSDADSVDGGKLLQAGMYYLLVYATYGKAPYDITFREYKISKNSDGSPQTKEYQIIYAEMPMVFDLLFRFYQDVTDALLGKMVYVPNIFAMFDRDVALLAYIYRLDEPDVLKKEKQKAKIEDIAVLMQQKMAKNRNLKKFMEAKSSLFTSHVTLNYQKMQIHEKIKYKLMEHGMAVNFSDKVEGLTVDLYRYEPSVGIKMTTIEKYKKDIEQALGTDGVRILAPIPNTALIGFEVPKTKRQFVPLGSDQSNIAMDNIYIGVDVYGVSKTLDLREMPHLLVAGTTGSGKSMFLQTILMQLGQLPAEEVVFTLLDPKMVELVQYENHKNTLFYEDEIEKIQTVLANLVGEMNTRYALFKKYKVKSIDKYRELSRGGLPYIVVVVDEFADLIMQKGALAKDIKDCMILLAQKARAAGIHLIITTQRPSTKVVDGLIKANFPTRIAFKTASKVDSEIILDRSGAEVLLGKGDMLLMANSGISRLQGFLANN